VNVRRWRRWLVTGAVVTFAVAALVGLGYFVLMRAVLAHDAAGAARGRARAERQATTQARAFADAVITHSTDAAGPPDETLDQLRPHGLRVRATTRQPELVLVVASSAPYAEMFGGGTVTRCFAIGFHGLGTAAARYDLVQRPCSA
jgi:hypothetical protein